MKHVFLFTLILHLALTPAPAQHRSHSRWVDSPVPSNETSAPNRRTTLAAALYRLHQRHGIYFSYDEQQFGQHPVNAPGVDRGSLPKILDRVLDGSGLRYRQVGGQIYVVSPAADASRRATTPEPHGPAEGGTILRPVGGIETELLASRTLLLSGVRARLDQTIRGRVTAADDGKPLPGVSVVAKGTNRGTVTDAEGRYSLTVTDAVTTLVFSSVGYVRQEVDLAGRTALDVVLNAEESALNEVVVVGYGTQRRRDLTGSIASVSEREIKAVAVSSFDQSLQGRVAGVQVTSTSGRPGGGVSVRIRGANSISGGNEPLYVIDGFPIINDIAANDGGGVRGEFNPPNSALSALNPDDIVSIDVLKDASATAIYGTRGANGVVIITTKRGRTGRSQVDVSAYTGVQTLQRKLDLLQTPEYVAFENEARANATPVQPPLFPNPAAVTTNTDWQDELFRAAPISNVNLSLTGGTERTRYAVSGNYFSQLGIIQNSAFRRGSLRVNIDQRVGNRVNVGVNLTTSFSVNNGANTDAHGGGQDGNGLTLFGVLKTPPAERAYTPDGQLNRVSQITVDPFSNPLLGAFGFTDRTFTTNILANAFLDVQLLTGLTLRLSGGGNLLNVKRNNYIDRNPNAASALGGEASISTVFSPQWLTENTLTYSRTLGRHTVTVLGGFTAQKYLNERVFAGARNFGSDIPQYNNLLLGANVLPSRSQTVDWSLASFLGRVTYAFADRYYLTATVRADGSSRFGKDVKWGTFPSVSAAWRLSEEEFLKTSTLLSELKLRASYGVTGNQEIGTYQSLATYSAVTYPIGDVYAVGLVPTRVPNPNLSWERTAQTDVGLDLAVFRDRVRLTADYFYKKTSDLLLEAPVPYTTGYATSLQNLGEVENLGLELALNTVNLGGAFRWETSFNLARTRNRVRSLGGVNEIIYNIDRDAGAGILRVGEPVGSFFGYRYIGNIQTSDDVARLAVLGSFNKPGDPLFFNADASNNNLVINASDRVILGQGLPTLVYGITNSFSFKGFDLSVFVNGVSGNHIYGQPVRHATNLVSGNQLGLVRDRWTPTNPSNTVPRANFAGGGADVVSSRWVVDGAYWRLRNLTLGYNLPQKLLQPMKLRSARVYLSGQNLFTQTSYLGYDPEVGSFGQSNLRQGVDWGSYPPNKIVLVGVNLGL
jgi:TonB-linked SusC/RagA family outer membrane protein